MMFVGLLCTEDAGIGVCASSMRTWVIWELVNTAGRDSDSRATYKQTLSRSFISQTEDSEYVTHTHTHIHFSSHSIESGLD